MSSRARLIAAVALTGIAICTLLWLSVPPEPPRQVAGFLLAWIWPTITWFLWWNGDASEKLLIGAGTALMLNAILALLITYLPGIAPTWLFLLCVLVTCTIPLVLLEKRVSPAQKTGSSTRRDFSLLLALMIVALMLRLPGMGYKEFQGDEGVAMVRAASVLTGDDSEWFNHQKGPMEILLPLLGWGLAESINDYWARLPFTWAGVLVVLAIYWLGRKWFAPDIGLASGMLFAIGGFGIAFSRIVQYQSLVMLWGALALLMATRYRESGRWLDLLMSFSFLASALLAHYDAILIAPAVAWLVTERLRSKRQVSRSFLAAVAIAGLILALFYVPFLLSPAFARTFNYLLRDRVGVGAGNAWLAAGIADAWRMMTFYNSTWYIVGLTLGTALGILILYRRQTHFAAILYFAVPALFYLLLVGDPRTHVYTFFTGATILAGLGAIETWRFIRDRTRSPLPQFAAVLATLWLLVVAAYPALLFLDTSVERQRTWDFNRPLPALFPVTWDEPPEFGLFGFPHQAGWRAAGSLRSKTSFPYGSNEEPQITDWYMAQAPRTYCENANAFFLVTNAQDEVPYDSEWLSREMSEYGQVDVNGTPSLLLYGREEGQPLLRLEAEAHDTWLTPAQVAPSQRSIQIRTEANVGSQIKLLGYDIDAAQAHPGGQLLVTLYWQTLAPIRRNYQVFVHMYDGNLWAQHDGAPNCGFAPTTGWELGQIISDTHIIALPEDIPLGTMPVVIGMYDLITEDRLPINGDPGGALQLTEVIIEAG